MSLNDDIATFNESDFRIKLLAEYDGAVALDLTYTAGSVNIDFGLHFAARSDANQALIGFSSISEAGLGSRLGVNITSKSTPTIESRLIVAPSPPPPEFPPLSPGEELKETVGMWAIVAAEKDIAGKAVFDQGAFRRRMAQAWSVPTDQIALNVSVSTTNTSVAAVDSPTLASFSTQVNASVIAISNLYHSFCVEPIIFPPPPVAPLPYPPPPPPPEPPSPPPYPPPGAITCGPGTYKSAGACIACPAGTYSDQVDQAACVACVAGSYCEAVDTTKGIGAACVVPCPGGTYSTSTTLTTSAGCTNVDNGYYAPLGSRTQTQCPPGTKFDANDPSVCAACEAGKYSSALGSIQCNDCPAGYFCPAASADIGAVAPVPCPGGTYSAATTLTAATGCTDVEAGSYAPLGSTAPIACPAGGYTCPGRANDATNAVVKHIRKVEHTTFTSFLRSARDRTSFLLSFNGSSRFPRATARLAPHPGKCSTGWSRIVLPSRPEGRRGSLSGVRQGLLVSRRYCAKV